MAPEPLDPAHGTETGVALSDRRARAELRAALARMPSETYVNWALTVFNLGWIAGLVGFRLLK